jgi:hypothetical protein
LGRLEGAAGARRRASGGGQSGRRRASTGHRDEEGGDPGSPLAGELADQEALRSHVRYLADHLGPRPVGSEAVAHARQYILETLKTLGFSPELQSFLAQSQFYGRVRLATSDRRSIPCLPVVGSPGTSGTVRGTVRLMSSSKASFEAGEAAVSARGLVKRCVKKIRRPPSRCPASLALR